MDRNGYQFGPKPPTPEDDGRHLDIEEDYESVHQYGWRPDPFSEGTIPVGMCMNMCSFEEFEERERQKRLSKFELDWSEYPPKGDRKLAMKEFKRSAAGREFTKAVNLRPWSVLKKSLHYLLLDICLRDDDWMYISGFVFDRLKSIRQDMIIQRIEGLRCVEILEGSIRFLVYSMFRLTCTLRDYVQDHLSKTKLSPDVAQVCGLDNYEMHVVGEMKLTMQCLRDCLQSLIVQYQDFVPDGTNRFLFEAINIIVNLPQLLGHHYISTDLMSNHKLHDSSPMFKKILRMRREHFIGNHYGALKYLKDLTEYPLIILAYASIIPMLQMNSDYGERLLFTVFLAVQLGAFDFSNRTIDFNAPSKELDTKRLDPYQQNKLIEQIVSDNETRVYALQMIIGRNWHLFDEVVRIYGAESVLDPGQ